MKWEKNKFNPSKKKKLMRTRDILNCEERFFFLVDDLSKLDNNMCHYLTYDLDNASDSNNVEGINPRFKDEDLNKEL